LRLLVSVGLRGMGYGLGHGHGGGVGVGWVMHFSMLYGMGI